MATVRLFGRCIQLERRPQRQRQKWFQFTRGGATGLWAWRLIQAGPVALTISRTRARRPHDAPTSSRSWELEAARLQGELDEATQQLAHLRKVVMHVDVYATSYVWRAPDGTEHVMNPADVTVYVLAGSPSPFPQLPWDGKQHAGGTVRIQRNGNLIRIGDSRGYFTDLSKDVAEQGARALLGELAKDKKRLQA